ncbi:MAG: hypothetical protein ACO3RG_05580, partial [Nitriliruptoraceae bacterium]
MLYQSECLQHFDFFTFTGAAGDKHRTLKFLPEDFGCPYLLSIYLLVKLRGAGAFHRKRRQAQR